MLPFAREAAAAAEGVWPVWLGVGAPTVVLRLRSWDDGVWFDVADFVVLSVVSACFLLRRVWDSLSALSRTTFAMRSNSAQTLSMRRTLPFASSEQSVDKKETTRFINFRSDLVRLSCGFCKMLAKSVTSADTG